MNNAKILIVDDDADFASAIRAILESENYTVIIASGAAEGMETIKKDKMIRSLQAYLDNKKTEKKELIKESETDGGKSILDESNILE